MECWFYDIMRIQPAYITIMTIKLNTEHYDYNVDIIYMMTYEAKLYLDTLT